MNENEVALRAFDVHGLLLVLKGDVLSKVGPAEERVAAEVADEIWLCLYRRVDAPIHSSSRFQLLRVITLEVLHHIRRRSVE